MRVKVDVQCEALMKGEQLHSCMAIGSTSEHVCLVRDKHLASGQLRACMCNLTDTPLINPNFGRTNLPFPVA